MFSLNADAILPSVDYVQIEDVTWIKNTRIIGLQCIRVRRVASVAGALWLC